MSASRQTDRLFSSRFHPRRLIGGIHWRLNFVRDRWLRRSVERIYHKTRPSTPLSVDAPCVLADGMYDNPNHFFRLNLFLRAFDPDGKVRRVGVLRNRRETGARSSLEALGFRDFVFIDEMNYRIEDYRDKARHLLCSVQNYEDILALQLPEKIPAYVFFDTVVKVLRDPRPPLSDGAWEYYLAELLRNIDLFGELFKKNDIKSVVFSHGWKNEYAAAFWIALRNSIPAYHLTAYYESIRIRRLICCIDYECPKERLFYQSFRRLDPSIKAILIEKGWKNIEQRGRGDTTDINARHAFRPEKRPVDRSSARRWLDVSDNRRVGVVFAHAWFDFPHIFDMQNFTDFLDWMNETLYMISQNTDLDWYVKPHPLESWYGGKRLSELATNLPPHVRLLAETTDSLSVVRAADVCVTVHGTIGFEAAAQGVPVICGDRSYYSDWPFVYLAESREEYRSLIANAAHLPKPDASQRDLAAVFAYLATGPNPGKAGLLKIRCDSIGHGLYGDIVSHCRSGKGETEREIMAIAEWLASDSDSYSIHTKLCHHFARMDQSAHEGVLAVSGKY